MRGSKISQRISSSRMSRVRVVPNKRASRLLLFLAIQSVVCNSIAQKTTLNFKNDVEEIDSRRVRSSEPNSTCKWDESECENSTVLFFYTYKKKTPNKPSPSCYTLRVASSPYNRSNCQTYEGYEKLELRGTFLETSSGEDELSVSIIDNQNIIRNNSKNRWTSSDPTNIFIDLSGQHRIDIFYTVGNENHEVQVARNGSVIHSSKREGGNNKTIHDGSVSNPVFDWVTKTVYYIDQLNSRVKVCDQDFLICVDFDDKLCQNPVFLAISPKDRLLFWIERNSSQFDLFKYGINDLSKTRIARDIKAPIWLTVDVPKKRVYWMNSNLDTVALVSTTFDGKNLMGVPSAARSFTNISSFATHRGILYYSDDKKQVIWKCSVKDCMHPAVFKNLSTSADLRIGHLIVGYQSSLPNETANNVSCGHSCARSRKALPIECRCEEASWNIALQFARKNFGSYRGSTLIGTYKNHLYVIGLFGEKKLRSVVDRYILDGIASVAAVTYDSLNGNVIFTEEQRIYSFNPRTRRLERILDDDKPDRINVIECDESRGRLYWISTKSLSVKMMDLTTRSKSTLIKGRQSYVPTGLTLFPVDGYMLVLYAKRNNTYVTVEQVSLNKSRLTRKIRYEAVRADMENIFLHPDYIPDDKLLYSLDPEKNESTYFSCKYSDFIQLIANSENKIDTITSMNGDLMWLERSANSFLLHIGAYTTYGVPYGVPYDSCENVANNVTTTVGSSIVKSGWKSMIVSGWPKCISLSDGCDGLCLLMDAFAKHGCIIQRDSCKRTDSTLSVEPISPEAFPSLLLLGTLIVATSMSVFIVLLFHRNIFKRLKSKDLVELQPLTQNESATSLQEQVDRNGQLYFFTTLPYDRYT